MKQRSFAESGYGRRPKLTKRQQFLADMAAVIPWGRPEVQVAQIQPQRGPRGGRKSFAVSTMLRVHFMQQWFALCDPGMEEALHDIPAMRVFAGLDAGDDLVPDESSILMKAHIGVDADSRLTHTVITTLANVNDVTQANDLLHGDETDVCADAGYRGTDKRSNANPAVRWQIAMRLGQRRALPDTKLGRLLNELEWAKAQIRAKVKHPFRVIKRQFGYQKTRYRGLAKNTAQVVTLFALANVYQARRYLMPAGMVCS